MPDINYVMIGDAIAMYQALGYTYLETPWWVSQDAVGHTLPRGVNPFVIRTHKWPGGWAVEDGPPEGFLVGSAEQSMIHLMLTHSLSPGLYVMAGPCFRNEIVVDEFHHQSFFKVELACVYLEGTLPSKTIFDIIKDAQVVHSRVGGVIPELVTMPDGKGYDLEVKGVEVGSYGQRSLDGFGWVYGTGLALPRFTQAMNRG